MNPSETDIELVEKFFDAELDDQGRQDFSNRLNNDESFRKLVEQERAILAAVRFEGLARDLRYLKQVESTISNTSIAPTRRRWLYYAAAAVAGIIALAIFWLPTFRPTPDQLFQAYFVPYPNVIDPTVRDNSEPTNDLRSQAFRAYEQKNYQRAADLFTQLTSEKKEPGILLLLGNANLILGNTDEAIKNFGTLSKEFDELDMQAKWYLSLCYLKRGDVEEAKQMLKELGETEISYAEKAKELLKKVD